MTDSDDDSSDDEQDVERIDGMSMVDGIERMKDGEFSALDDLAEDVKAGNDAREFDAVYDDATPVDNDGRSRTETTFFPQDAPRHERRRWKRLFKIQDGVGVQDRSVRNAKANYERDARTWCSQLEYSAAMTDRVVWLVENIPMSEVKQRKARAEAVILAMISLVGNEYDRHVQREQEFKALQASLDVETKELRELRQRIRGHSQYQ